RELQRPVWSKLRTLLRRHKARQLFRINRSRLAELDTYKLALSLNRIGADPHRLQFKRGVLQQVADSSGRLPVTIDQFRAHIVQLRLGLDSRHPLVHPQPLVLFLYIVGRNTNVEPKIELDFRDFHARLALHFTHGAFQHLVYSSNPTASMWPLCSPPRRFPAPRSSRSR